MDLKNQLESLLFISHKPLAVSELAKLTESDKVAIEAALRELEGKYQQNSGIELLKLQDKYQMAASEENTELISKFLNTEVTGELTRPSLETLTIIAYRGPISKVELELIRGVNCSLILRNLLLRGLIEAEEDKIKATTVYSITFEFLKHLGLKGVEELPDFVKLNKNNNLEKLLQGLSVGSIEKDLGVINS
jgi:segregation and condensation protein B